MKSMLTSRYQLSMTQQEKIGLICDNKRYFYFKSLLLKYIKFIQSPSRQESLLKSAQYSLWLLSKFYNVSTTVTTLAGNNAGKSVSCTDGEEEEQQQMSRIPKALLELKTEISWARYLLRFFALPAAMNAIDDLQQPVNESSNRTDNNNNKKNNNNNRSARFLQQIMSWSMIGYYPLDHCAYLCWKTPTLFSNEPKTITSRKASKAAAWSSRFWLTYLLSDTVRCSLILKNKSTTSATTTTYIPPRSSGTIIQNENIKLTLVRNILCIMPALHWSFTDWDSKPWLDDTINGLCWLESVVGLIQEIRNFQ